MKILLGPFHPNLEQALAREICTERAKDSLAPILVLVPSDALRRRIKTLLAAEHGLNLLNFRVHTFFQLTCTLLEEVQGLSGIRLRDDTFMEEALRHVVAIQEKPVSFAAMIENDGTCAALWQSLRDLKDGLLDPETALDALDEGYFARSDEPGLRELLTLYWRSRAHFAACGARDYGDLDTLVEPLVGASKYLAQFSHIYYYGFYDLTQSQLELFRSVARHFPVTLCYPLIEGHPGWSFAERFYTRYLQGLAGAGGAIELTREDLEQPSDLSLGIFTDNPGDLTEKSQNCAIVSCSGTRDELLFAAKETLRLVEHEGLRFEEIGLVARALEPYVSYAKEILPEHGIPFNTSAREPLMRFNLVKAILLLADLSVKDFPRAQVIDLLASPYFKTPPASAMDAEPRPEVWDILTRALRITRGMAEWNRLERYAETGLELGLSHEEEGKPFRASPAQVRALLGTVHGLHEKLIGLPREGTWSYLTDRWVEILHEFIRLDGDRGQSPESVPRAVEDIFAGLSALDAVSAKTSLSYFIRLLRKKLARASIPVTAETVPGVYFLDAMSARGMPFRALFLLGMNEGVFPRTIREDPFLRDRARRVIETDLGCKVSEKLAAYDEEKLLFSLCVSSAREHLYLTYQRSDTAGRALAPSWYLGEMERTVPAAGIEVRAVSLPRGVLGKECVPPFDDAGWMLPSELAVRKMLCLEDPTVLIPLTGASPEMYERGINTINALENQEAPPGPLDGLTGPLPEFWQRMAVRGVSPTSLEAYVRCPFQYFARYVLRLERLERPEGIPAVAPVEMGKICHEILHRFYESGGAELYGMSFAEWRPLLECTAAAVLSDYEREWPTGYPVEWQVLQQELTALVLEVAHADLDELTASGFRPVAFEKDLHAHFASDWPDPSAGMRVHGRLDRIDHDVVNRRLRVVDYKFKGGRSPRSNDRDLVRSAIRGSQLQPPIYTLLGAEYARSGRVRREDVEAAFYFIAPHWDEGPLVVRSFPGEVWEGPAGAGIRRTVAEILEGIGQGEFVILPGEYCKYCEVSEICRKTHPPSRARAASHPRARTIVRMRRGDNSKIENGQ